MKSNDKSSKITLKVLGIYSVAVFAVFLALRFYQLLKLSDPKTGFFTDHSNVSVPLFYIIFVALVFVTFILTRLCSETDGKKTPESRSIFHAASCLLFSLPLLLNGGEGLAQTAKTVSDSLSFKSAVAQLGGYIYVAVPLFAFLSGLMMLANAIAFATGKMFIKKLKLCSLFPVFWSFFLTISYFTITASYLKVTQLMLTIFANAFFMLFLFEYARFISDINFSKSAWTFYACGIIAAVLLLVTSVPNLVFNIFSPERLIVYCPFEAYHLFGGLFTITALIYVSRCEKPIAVSRFTDDAAVEPPAEEEENR